MKAESLYHLLMLRLAELPKGALPPGFVAGLRHSLKTSDKRNTLHVTWAWAGKRHEITLSGNEFEFHVRADIPSARPEAGGRGRNWQRATDLIGRIAADSGIAFSAPTEAAALAPLPADPVHGPGSLAGRFGWSLLPIAAALAMPKALALPQIAPLEALAAALAALLLISFAERMVDVVPALRISWIDRLVIALGTLCAGLIGGTALHVAALAAAAHIAIEEERRPGGGMVGGWVLAGALAAAPALLSRSMSLLPVAAFAVMLGLMAAVMPYRMRWAAVLGLVVGAVVVATPALFSTGEFRDLASRQALILVPFALVAIVGTVMLGRQYLLSPLLSLAAWTFGAASGVTISGQGSLVGFGGLLLVLAVRFALLLAGTARPRLIAGAVPPAVAPPAVAPPAVAEARP